MGMSFTFSMCSIFYSLLLTAIFFTKKKVSLIENKIYGYLIICNLIGTILGTLDYFTIRNSDSMPFINEIVSRGMIIYFLSWISLFTVYVFMISRNKKQETQDQFLKFYKRLKGVFGVIYIAFAVIIIALPLYYFNEAGVVYSYGPAATFMYIVFVGYVVSFYIAIFKSKNKLRNVKLIPVITFSILGGFVAIIQRLNPGLLLMTAMETFITFLMYFTIENPDVNMLNELYKNKELMEQNYEDKYNFLFEMTQEARNPLVNINNLSNALRMEDDKEKIKEGLLTMSNLVRQLDFSINDILNISSLDIQKIKVVNNKYELEKLCNDLEIKIKPEVKDGVKFTLTMPKQLPILYGDYMKIKQILYSLLVNSCKNTTSGHINMSVNLIEKYDVARLIFNISDTGGGMPIEQINDILSSTGSLDKQELENLEKKEYNVKLCQKVVKIMGGNLMIKSNVGEGTDVILTVDQKVFHEKDRSILTQYENDIANYRKVLIVSQNKDALGIIKRKLTDNHITYSNLYYGADAIDRIKSGKKFDFILVDDEMKEMSGFMTLKGMKEISGFDIPVIIMLREDKKHIKDHYIDDGFKDYLLLDNLESELNRIIEKY